MDGILKAAAGALISAILAIILQKQGKEYALTLVIAVSAMGACLALTYIKPVLTFVEQLCALGSIDSEIMKILFKAVGIGLIAEISGTICSDSGNASLGKILQLLSVAVILWLSLPIFQQVVDLIGEVLEGV